MLDSIALVVKRYTYVLFNVAKTYLYVYRLQLALLRDIQQERHTRDTCGFFSGRFPALHNDMFRWSVCVFVLKLLARIESTLDSPS